jgi:hypothetical protein
VERLAVRLVILTLYLLLVVPLVTWSAAGEWLTATAVTLGLVVVVWVILAVVTGRALPFSIRLASPRMPETERRLVWALIGVACVALVASGLPLDERLLVVLPASLLGGLMLGIGEYWRARR